MRSQIVTASCFGIANCDIKLPIRSRSQIVTLNIHFFLCTLAAIPQSGTRFARRSYFFFWTLAATFNRSTFNRMKPVASSWL
jgi:hypothetical protein